MIIALLLIFAAYLLCGVFFAVPFVLTGVQRVDPRAAHGTWGFRMLLFPGSVFLWPLLLQRWRLGSNPPSLKSKPRRAGEIGGSTAQTVQSET